MDGASKFVRGDAIAGLIITAVNIIGGIVIGVTRHDMSLAAAADVFTKLSVGDGLVTQIPALIVSLAAGLLVSKGGVRGSTRKRYSASSATIQEPCCSLALPCSCWRLAPGLPFLPFAFSASLLAFTAYIIPKRRAEARAAEEAKARAGGGGGRGGSAALGQGIRCARQRSSSASASRSRARCSRYTANSPSALARCAATSPANTVSSSPRSS